MHLSVAGVLAVVFAFANPSYAQAQGDVPTATLPDAEDDTQTTGSGATVAPAAEAAAPNEQAAVGDIDRRRQEAMSDYSVGQNEAALEKLQELIKECSSGQVSCGEKQEAELLRDLGIVQAGGLQNHEGAVRAFHQAFVLNPDITLSKRYGTDPVLRAYKEAAQSSQAAGSQAPSQAEPAPAGESPQYDEDLYLTDEEDDEPTKRSLFIFAEGTAKYGLFGGRNLNNNNFGPNEIFATRLGGDLTVGSAPDRGGFAIAGRGRGGAYIFDDGNGSYGYFGGAALFGALMGDPSDGSFMYVFGGTGLEHLPDPAFTALTFHAMVGANLSGFMIGGGIDFGFSDDYGFLQLGLQIGYGGLL